MEHNAHQEHKSSSAGIWAVLFMTFAPAALTLAWVIHLASAGR